jgi:hypothetical protein
MRFAFVLWYTLLCGYALAMAQDFAPAHAGAAANGGSGSVTELLVPILVMLLGLIILAYLFALLQWLCTLPRVLWRKLREIL